MSEPTTAPDPAAITPLPEHAIAMLRDSAAQACAVLLCQLTQGERNVGELEALVGLHQPSLSQHLGVLRDEGLVATRREGKYIYYRLASFEVIQIMQTLSSLYCGKVLAQS
jgi:DNA-binding transcriptional ArsR family regulator